MKEISSWKLEAKLEDSDRYFYHTSDINRVDDGSICYVIGRKGSGKTAIAEFLYHRSAHNHFADRLSFKNFPFNDLYGLTNDRYTPPNQYITLWKWLIYCHIAKLMIKNEAIDGALRNTLAQVFPVEPIQTLARSISRLTNPGLKFSFLGAEISGSMSSVGTVNDSSWIERCDVLEDLIAKNLDQSIYTIVFDELDEDYKSADSSSTSRHYLELLTSLFKAVQDVKATFPAGRYGIRPIIFLRNDIYDILKDPDKTKWNDLRLDLHWNLQSIRNLMGFRIGRANDPDSPPLDFGEALKLAARHYESMKPIRNRSLIEWIGSQTLSRPRDYVSFFRISAESSLQRNAPFIDALGMLSSVTPYSTYLRSEVQDELSTALPEIRDVLNVIARIGRPLFSFANFNDEYERYIKPNPSRRPAEEVLAMLFRFGVIGNRTSIGGTVSGLRSGELEFNPELSINVLRGLLPALRIKDEHGQSFAGGLLT